MDVSGGLSLIQAILDTLGSPIWREIESKLGGESQLVKLKKTISTIQAVLLDADQEELHQQQRRSHVERDRLQRLNDALYKADDLFDEIATLTCRKNLMLKKMLVMNISTIYCNGASSKMLKKIHMVELNHAKCMI